MTVSYVDGLFSVAGKTALVTGGNRGIGRAIAEGLLRSGARVYISSRNAAACEAAAAELSSFGNCIALPADLAEDAGRVALATAFGEREQKLHILVNNAGAIWAAPLADYPQDGWDKVFDLNVRSVFFLIQSLLPLLEAAAIPDDPARIVNVGSANVLRIPAHETYAYVSSKAALHQLTRQLAGQLAARSITANVLAPGIYPSKMQAAAIARRGEAAVLERVPIKRVAAPDDMAAAVLYLVSRAGSYVTGSVMPVDGGMGTTV